MKIGILTYHRAHNYGAVLQAYALQKYLQNMGHTAELIDYRPDSIEEVYKRFIKFKVSKAHKKYPDFLRFIKYLLYQIPVRFLSRYKRCIYFKEFISDKLNCSQEIYDGVKELDYDLCICGSDQIWNPSNTLGLDRIYWGDFKVSKSSKKITYAASSSFYDFDEIQRDKIKRYLSNFNLISVRESSLQTYLKNNFGIESTHVLDPVLLVGREIWDNIAIKPKISNYVAVYFPNQKTLDETKNMVKNNNLKILGLFEGYSYRNLLNKQIKSYRVEEFVGIIKYSDFVICSSYHGMVFSLIFRKQFYFIGDKGKIYSDRSLSLLSKLGIEDRIVPFIPKDKSIIDYDIINDKIEELRGESMDYLNKAFYL